MVMLAGAPARGAEVTRVVSALDDDNRFDFHLTASWLHEVKSALVKRESQQPPASTTEVLKDLKYGQTRDILDLRADFGVLWDVSLRFNLPIVLADSAELAFDGGNCGAQTGGFPTCIDQNNSTLLRDGILPGYGATSWGLDARNNRQYSGATDKVFRGPRRSGIENLGVGITWAAFNQARDDTKPTWTLSFDAKFDVFKAKRFDPENPAANTAVGLGYHQMIFSTFVSKRFRYFDPYVGGWYMLPARTTGSPFTSFSGGSQTEISPQHHAGLLVGVEQVAWENVQAQQRVTIEARFRMEQIFFGRGYSELWEPLSGPSSCTSNFSSSCRPGIDLDLDGDGNGDRPYPGISTLDGYSRFGGDLGLNVQVGRYIRFRALGGLAADMPHFITAAGAGVDRDGDRRIDPANPTERNPVYREAIDLPGRRFRVEGTKIWTVFIQGSLMF